MHLKKRIVLSCLFGVFLMTSLTAQEYFSKLITFPYGNPTVNGLYEYQGEYLVPMIYVDSASELKSALMYTNIMEIDYALYADFNFSHRPISIITDGIYAWGKDRSQMKALKLIKLNPNTFETEWGKEVESNGEFNFPTYSLALDSFIYSSYLMDYEEEQRTIGLVNMI